MRIAFYFIHRETLGEFQRAWSIAQRLSCNHDVLFINAGTEFIPMQTSAHLSVMHLPHPFADKNTLRYGTRQATTPEVVRIRAQQLQKSIAAFAPDLFITTSFPFMFAESMYELLPSIQHAKQQGARIIASTGYPMATMLKPQLFKLYDEVWMHCPKELDATYLAREYPDDLCIKMCDTLEQEGKLVYTNYILPDESRIEQQPEQDFLFISRGSGVLGEKLVAEGTNAAKKLNVPYKVVHGITEKNQTNTQHSVAYLDQATFTKTLLQSRWSLSMAGYGTAVQLLYTKKSKSILMPKPARIDTEQYYRAHMLQELLGSVVLEEETLDVNAIAAAMHNAPEKPAKTISEDWFTGLDVVEKQVKSWLYA